MGEETECVSLLRRSYQESARNFTELTKMNLLEKKRVTRDLDLLYANVEKSCSEGLSTKDLSRALSNLRLAQLRTALSIRNDPAARGINDPDLNKALDRFTADEYAMVEKLERFSNIDSLNSQSITTLLVNKDDQIYRLIKEWYEDNMEDFLGAIDLLSGRNVRGEVASALEERYRNRFQKLVEGIVDYIQQDPGQIRKLFINYENSMKNALQIESKRLEARKKIVDLVSSEEFEDAHDRASSIIMLGKAKNIDALAKSDADGVIRSLKLIEAKMREAIADLEDERGKLENDPEMKINPVLKEIEKNRLVELVEEASIKRETIVGDIEQLENLKSLAIMSSSGAHKSYGSTYSCTYDEVSLRKHLFFESTTNFLRNGDNVPLYVARYRYSGNIRNKVLVNAMERLSDEPLFSDRGREISKSWSTEFILRKFMSDVRVGLNLTYIAHDALFLGGKDSKGSGIDETPCDVEDFTEVYSSLVQYTRDRDCYFISIIGSPNGYSKDLIDMVTRQDGKGLSGTNVLILLRDMKSGEVFYNASDPCGKYLGSLLSSGKDLETVNYETVRNETLSESGVTGVARMKTICKLSSLSEAEVTRAWKRLESERTGKIDQINGEFVFRLAAKNGGT
ncbi:MAG: hypothetical protein M1533_03275 [Candidatus Thermoplasmatota archaeon]|nr:hypothetical protein [Candidatus Thermoplasmatota archaeon]